MLHGGVQLGDMAKYFCLNLKCTLRCPYVEALGLQMIRRKKKDSFLVEILQTAAINT